MDPEAPQSDTTREKIWLKEEQETLLIPLFSKAQDNPILIDEKARQILNAVAYDFGELRVPQKTQVTLRIRAKQLDRYTENFLASHPTALILHLGCGLDSRALRVPGAERLWMDLDMPEVIELRRKFYPESESYRLIGSSVMDLAWLDRVPQEDRPAFIVAEGLLMYLRDSQVRELLLSLHERFPGSSLAFDAFSKLTVDRIKAHPSLQKTGATIHWGIDDPREIEGWAQGIHLVEEWFFSQSPDIPRLSWYYRLMFGLTASIRAAQRAHRLLYYTL
jgi:O-methyltransferase involved in polyketide biosynthesis